MIKPTIKRSASSGHQLGACLKYVGEVDEEVRGAIAPANHLG